MPKIYTVRFGPGRLGGRFKPYEKGHGAVVTKIRKIDKEKKIAGPLELQGIRRGMLIHTINMHEVLDWNFKDILQHLLKACQRESVLEFIALDEEEEEKKVLEPEERRETTEASATPAVVIPEKAGTPVPIQNTYPADASRDTIESSTRASMKEAGAVVSVTLENASLRIDPTSASTEAESTAPKSTDDDLDEFEAFLDSSCREAASLAVEVGRHKASLDIAEADEIDSHIEALMVDL